MSETDIEEDDVPSAKISIRSEEDFDTQLRRLAQVSKEVARAEDAIKDLKKQKESLSYWLAQYMLSTGCKSKCLDDIFFKQTQRVYSRVTDKEKLLEWIESNNAYNLLMSVHTKKLTGYCNSLLEQGEDVPPGVDPSFIKYGVSVK